MKVYYDTKVFVAAAVEDHPHHSHSVAALALAQDGKIEGFASGHSLSEIYTVLTRTPFQPAVYPSEAWKILWEDFLPYFQLVTVTPEMYIQTIRERADRGWIGGRIYDAIHLRCARESDCERIYTLNVRHFQQLAPDLAQRIGAP
ncbi:MAG: type II toxin-antitoxin system VapC family toxin [Candidatus Acidiferrales bacterium]